MDENSSPGAVAALFGRLVEESLPGQRGETAWRALLHAHATLMRQLDTDLREDTGLRLADFDVLAQLAAAGGELRMTDLAARTLLSRSGLTRRVAGLVDQGLCTPGERRRGRARRGCGPDRRRCRASDRKRCRSIFAACPNCSSSGSTIRNSPFSRPPLEKSSSTARSAEDAARDGPCPAASLAADDYDVLVPGTVRSGDPA
jgi:hypothetical protein